MAKLLPGPLASSISGSVGEITFAQTKFGTIVQSKPVGPVHTTPAALASKSVFSRGMGVMTHLYVPLLDSIKAQAHTVHQTWSGVWLPALMALDRNGTWPGTPNWLLDRNMTSIDATYLSNVMHITWSTTGIKSPTTVNFLILDAHEIAAVYNGLHSTQFSNGRADLIFLTPVYPIDVFAIPTSFGMSQQIGRLAHTRIDAP